MNMSPEQSKFSPSFFQAQCEMSGAKKNAKNPFFKSDYADLKSVMEAIREPFANNGLFFVQAAEANGQIIAITTRIVHTSGEWIESITELPPIKNDVHGWISAFTYGKRLGLQSLAGLPSIDDDGNLAVKHATPPKAVPISSVQAGELQSLLEQTGSDIDGFLKYFSSAAGAPISSLNGFPSDLFGQAKKLLGKKIDEAA